MTLKKKTNASTLMLDTTIIYTLRDGGHNVTIGQLAGLVRDKHPSVKEAEVRKVAEKLVHEGLLASETERYGSGDNVLTRFRWAITPSGSNQPRYTIGANNTIHRDGAPFAYLGNERGRLRATNEEIVDLTVKLCVMLNASEEKSKS
jgi:hypothetical protein